MQANDLDDLFQSAYKDKHSTETALFMVTNGIEHALDDNNAVFLVMLDLSAAFDTIDHDMQCLEHGFDQRHSPQLVSLLYYWSPFQAFSWW